MSDTFVSYSCKDIEFVQLLHYEFLVVWVRASVSLSLFRALQRGVGRAYNAFFRQNLLKWDELIFIIATKWYVWIVSLGCRSAYFCNYNDREIHSTGSASTHTGKRLEQRLAVPRHHEIPTPHSRVEGQNPFPYSVSFGSVYVSYYWSVGFYHTDHGVSAYQIH